MGLTISSINKYGVGNRWHVTAQIAFDSSYPTGGEELLAASLGLKSIEFMLIENKSGIVFEYDYSNYKVKGYRTAAATPSGTVSAPVFTGSALATHTHDLKVIGGAAGGIDEPLGVEGTDTLAKDAATDRTIVGANSATKGGVVAITGGTPAGTNSAPTFTGAAIAQAALAEVTNATNLSAVTGVRIFAIGY